MPDFITGVEVWNKRSFFSSTKMLIKYFIQPHGYGYSSAMKLINKHIVHLLQIRKPPLRYLSCHKTVKNVSGRLNCFWSYLISGSFTTRNPEMLWGREIFLIKFLNWNHKRCDSCCGFSHGLVVWRLISRWVGFNCVLVTIIFIIWQSTAKILLFLFKCNQLLGHDL